MDLAGSNWIFRISLLGIVDCNGRSVERTEAEIILRVVFPVDRHLRGEAHAVAVVLGFVLFKEESVEWKHGAQI